MAYLTPFQDNLLVILAFCTGLLSLAASGTLILSCSCCPTDNSNAAALRRRRGRTGSTIAATAIQVTHRADHTADDNNIDDKPSWRRCCCLGSFCCSVLTRVTNRIRNLDSVYKRLMVGMSVADIIITSAMVLQPFVAPASTSTRPWAVGTEGTCTLNGFLIQFGNVAVWYNGFLTYYYVLTIRYKVSETTFQSWYEPVIHVVSIGYPLTTATIGAALDWYHENELGPGCWINEIGCSSPETDREDCRAFSTFEVGLIFSGIPMAFMLVSALTNNLLIYQYVRTTTKQSEQYNPTNHHNNNNTSSIMLPPPPTTTTTTTPSSCTGAAAATPAADPSLPLADADHTSSTIGTGESAALTPTPAVTTSTTINNPAASATTTKSLRASSFGQPIKFLRSSTMTTTTTTAITPNNGNNNNNNRVQQLVFHQCLLYVVAFWSCLTPLIVVRVLEGPFNWPRSQESQIYWLLIWQAICGPLQGCCNLLIYALPRYKQLRLLSKSRNSGMSRISCLRGALWGTDADGVTAALVGPQEEETSTPRRRKQKQKQQQQQQQQPNNLATAIEEGNDGNVDFAV